MVIGAKTELLAGGWPMAENAPFPADVLKSKFSIWKMFGDLDTL